MEDPRLDCAILRPMKSEHDSFLSYYLTPDDKTAFTFKENRSKLQPYEKGFDDSPLVRAQDFVQIDIGSPFPENGIPLRQRLRDRKGRAGGTERVLVGAKRWLAVKRYGGRLWIGRQQVSKAQNEGRLLQEHRAEDDAQEETCQGIVYVRSFSAVISYHMQIQEKYPDKWDVIQMQYCDMDAGEVEERDEALAEVIDPMYMMRGEADADADAEDDPLSIPTGNGADVVMADA